MESTPNSNEEILNLSNICAQAADILLSFSIPLYLLDNNRPWLCGTGFIVRTPNGHFLVSAAHVLDDAKEKKIFFYSASNKPRPVRGPLLRSSDRMSRHSDPFDIAVVKLIDGDMPPFAGVNKRAIDISWLYAKQRPRTGKMYVIIGFPQSKSRVSSSTVEVKSYPYRSSSIEESEYYKFGLNPDTHLALPLNLKVGFDPEGKHRNFPKPQGISGAPIFELYREDEKESLSIFPVVAIGIEYRSRDKILIGTDIHIVLDMIEKLSE